MIKTIKGVIDEKGDDLICIESGATVYQALEIMAKNNIGALVVKNKVCDS